MPEKVSVKAALGRMTRAYEPEPLAMVDDHQALLVRYDGEYPEHLHDRDEFLLCIEGVIEMDMPGGKVTLNAQEGLRIPKGTPHTPSGKGGVGIIFESARIHTSMPGKT